MDPWDFGDNGKFTTLQFEEVNGWSVGQVFLLEPREKSHGQVDEATLPLCVMLRKLHVFPSEKGKKHQFCLPRKWEIHLQDSPRLDLKNRHFFSSFPSSFPPIIRNTSHPSKVPRRNFALQGCVKTSAGHPRST